MFQICKDPYSGLCVDCTTILSKEVSRVSMAKILRMIEEEVSNLGVEEVLRKIREGEEQEELDRALEECDKLLGNLFKKFVVLTVAPVMMTLNLSPLIMLMRKDRDAKTAAMNGRSDLRTRLHLTFFFRQA